jgi:hypothetical protein
VPIVGSTTDTCGPAMRPTFAPLRYERHYVTAAVT